MARLRWIALTVAVIPACLGAVLIGAWALDTTIHAGQTMRNIDLAGTAVGGLGDEELFRVLGELDAELASTPVVIRTPNGELSTTAGEVGLVLDQAATARNLSTIGREGPMLKRPASWLSALWSPEQAEINFTVTRSEMTAGVQQLIDKNKADPLEPTIELVEGRLRGVPGASGGALDLDSLAISLEESAELGITPIVVDAAPVSVPTVFPDTLGEQLATQANELTQAAMAVSIGDTTRDLAPEVQRSWFTTEVVGERLLLAAIHENIVADLEAAFADVKTEPTPAHFDVVFDADVARPVVVDGLPGEICCDAAASTVVWETLMRGGQIASVGLTQESHERDREWAESLGVEELIGEFTTNHACCENRVTNIHLIADLTRGVLIGPGESFSVNDFVGKRTREKGFVSAGVIQNGVFTESVGGGISQFATTLFNAAFFAGLDFGEYQSHSIYISRYPYGREATLSYPHPDLQIVNESDNAVLIWPTYTDTSITVRLFSTKTVTAEQTGQSESAVGRCKRVTTQRTRTWLEDGRTEVDTVFAVYRPAEGVNCS